MAERESNYLQDRLHAAYEKMRQGGPCPLTPEDKVYHGFGYTNPADKKLAAEYFKKAIKTWIDDEQLAEESKIHELGHALADNKKGSFHLQVKPHANGFVFGSSYMAEGARTPEELIKITKGARGDLSPSDRDQLEILRNEIIRTRKWWQLWKYLFPL